MHTEVTLAWLEQVTTDLGHLMQDFQDKTCAEFNTTELVHEVEARNRCNAQKKGTKMPNQSCKVKSLNLLTYKFHALVTTFSFVIRTIFVIIVIRLFLLSFSYLFRSRIFSIFVIFCR